MYLRTKALILSSVGTGEYDFLVHALSPEWGLLYLRLRGARRSRARLRFLKEPGVFADLHIFGRLSESAPAKLLTGTLEETFEGIRERLEAFQAKRDLLSFARRLLVPFDPKASEKLCLMLEALARLASMETVDPAWILSCKLKMLDLSGWRLSSAGVSRYLDEASLELCRALEMGQEPRTAARQSLEKLSRIAAAYVDDLICR